MENMSRVYRVIPLLSLILLLASCMGKKNVNGTNNTANDSVSQTEDKGSEMSLNDLYLSLPTINLPIFFDMDLLEGFDDYKNLKESDYHRLTDIQDIQSYYDSSVRVARLPKKYNLQFIMSKYQSAGGEQIMELYSLSVDLTTKDRLQIYSVEELENGNAIVQTFEIDGDFHIKVSKHLNEVLIEQLTYTPTRVGVFEEVRDGKTPTVAFDSFDGKTYIIETFIWDHNSSGGLIKKNRSVENYRLTEDGLVNANKDHSKASGVGMTISPKTYKSVPEKVTLNVSNKSASTIEFGAAYEIEKQEKGQWVKREFPEGIAFIEIMYMLDSGKSQTYDISLYPDQIKYKRGKYRVRKYIMSGGERTPYFAEFTID